MVLVAVRSPRGEPAAEAAETAKRLSNRVERGDLGDCDALADFAAERAVAVERDQFLADFNVFIPRGKANYPLGLPLGLLGGENPIKLEGRTSGYRERLSHGLAEDRLEGLPHDQAHHFAPYFLLGARLPAWVGPRFLKLAEPAENWGDHYLARAALRIGGDLRAKMVAPAEVAERIRRLCEDRGR